MRPKDFVEPMNLGRFLPLVPLIGLLVCAAAFDLRSRRIPNWLTLGVILCGIAQSFTLFKTVTPGQACLGFLAGFTLPFVLFAMGALGGGDVKLLAGVGTWLGVAGALGVFVAAAVVGLVLVLCQALWQRRLPQLLRNSAVLVVNLVHLNEVGMEHAVATGRSCRSVDRPLPYAVPILVGTLLVAAQLYGGA